MTRARQALLRTLYAAGVIGAAGCTGAPGSLDAGADASAFVADVGASDGGGRDVADPDAGGTAPDGGADQWDAQTDTGPGDLGADTGDGRDATVDTPDQGPPPTLPEGTVTPLSDELQAEVAQALPAAHAFLLSQGDVDPFAHFAGDLLARRFGVVGFEQALPRFDQAIAAAPGPVASIMRLLRRVFDFDSALVPGDLESLDAETDRVTMPALHCDRAAWPADYDARLLVAEAQGGYGATHVALAFVWASDHGCALPLSPWRWVAVVDALVDIVAPAVATDLTLEAAALLHYLGQGFRVPDALVRATLDAQQADGGWDWAPGAGAASNWHSTGLALWYLHERLGEPTLDTMSAGPR